MIVIRRKKDNEIMHDLMMSDWDDSPKAKVLQSKIEQVNALPKGTPENIKKPFTLAIQDLQQQRVKWGQNRILAVMKKYGGMFEDYEVIKVPEEEKTRASKARYIECDENDEFTIHDSPLYFVREGDVVVTAGWMAGNYRLLEDDVTKFSELVIEKPVFFKLCAYRVGDDVSIELFIWGEDEDCGDTDLPNMIFLGAVCQGVLYPDPAIEFRSIHEKL